jgi:hypothetical protein
MFGLLSQGAGATGTSVPSDRKKPRQDKLETKKKASWSSEPMRLASLDAAAEELTGMLLAAICLLDGKASELTLMLAEDFVEIGKSLNFVE